VTRAAVAVAQDLVPLLLVPMTARASLEFSLDTPVFSSLMTLHSVFVNGNKLAVRILKDRFEPPLAESTFVNEETIPGKTFLKASSSETPSIMLSSAAKAANRTLTEGPSVTPSSITVTLWPNMGTFSDAIAGEPKNAPFEVWNRLERHSKAAAPTSSLTSLTLASVALPPAMKHKSMSSCLPTSAGSRVRQP